MSESEKPLSTRESASDSCSAEELHRRRQRVLEWYFQRAEIVQRGTENYYNVTAPRK